MRKKLRMKQFLAAAAVIGALTLQPAYAAGNTKWDKSVDASYDLTVTNTLLMYKDELHDGGINFATDSMTTDSKSADLAIDPYSNLGAFSVIDLGKVDFSGVTSVPDSGYSTSLKAIAGHVYIVQTHDGKFVKVWIKSILAKSVQMSYAFLISQGPDSGTGGSGTGGTGDTSDSGSDNGFVFEEGGVVLSWPVYSGAASYDLLRSDNGSDFTKLTDFPLTDTTFTDKYALAGHTYYYKYVAYDANDAELTESKPIKVSIVSKKMQPDPSRDSTTIVLHIGDQVASVNGAAKNLDVAPVVVDGRTLVPLRFIAEALGAKVGWNQDEQKITLNLGSDTLQLWINQSSATVDGQTVYMDVPPQVINDRTMVPVRFVTENLKEQVAFDGHTQTVTITGKSPKKSDDKLAGFYGAYKLIVPSSVVDGQGHAGVNSGGIAINQDGTYNWISTFDQKTITGNWKASGDSEYPILIVNGEGGEDWKLGASTKTLGGDIVLWDGYIWKIGTKLSQ